MSKFIHWGLVPMLVNFAFYSNFLCTCGPALMVKGGREEWVKETAAVWAYCAAHVRHDD